MSKVPTDQIFIMQLLPANVVALFDGSSPWQQIHTGRSGDSCFRLKLKDASFAFLKTRNNNDPNYFDTEIKALSWLGLHVETPQVIASGEGRWAQNLQAPFQFLLTSALPGKDLAQLSKEISPTDVSKICAESMRNLHSISIENCPLNQRLEVKVPRAKMRLSQGHVDMTDFDSERTGWTESQLLAELENTIPKEEDLVVCHGDFSLPNLIAHKNQFSGFVDLGRAGVADRHQDIALCLKSLEYNLGMNVQEEFLKTYDLADKLDEDKIYFYKLLDEFF